MWCSPSFLSNWTDGGESTLNYARGMYAYILLLIMPEVCTYRLLLARLREIKSNISSYNSTLYRACANANPHNMNGAMIGISKEVRMLYIFPAQKSERSMHVYTSGSCIVKCSEPI